MLFQHKIFPRTNDFNAQACFNVNRTKIINLYFMNIVSSIIVFHKNVTRPK